MKVLSGYLPESIEAAATGEAITYCEYKTSRRSRNPFEGYDHKTKRC